jgi:hypothetical protein
VQSFRENSRKLSDSLNGIDAEFRKTLTSPEVVLKCRSYDNGRKRAPEANNRCHYATHSLNLHEVHLVLRQKAVSPVAAPLANPSNLLAVFPIDLRLSRGGHVGEKRHLLKVACGLGRAWARSSPALSGALAEFQRHKESACRVGEMVFAPSPTGEQIEMLAGMAEVLLHWF